MRRVVGGTRSALAAAAVGVIDTTLRRTVGSSGTGIAPKTTFASGGFACRLRMPTCARLAKFSMAEGIVGAACMLPFTICGGTAGTVRGGATRIAVDGVSSMIIEAVRTVNRKRNRNRNSSLGTNNNVVVSRWPERWGMMVRVVRPGT